MQKHCFIKEGLLLLFIMGYAIEIALKRKIFQTLSFAEGFPEDQTELLRYIGSLHSKISPTNIARPPLQHIKDIRNHNLSILLKYSGTSLEIQHKFNSQWRCVNTWNPNQRYLRRHLRKITALNFMSAANTLIKAFI